MTTVPIALHMLSGPRAEAVLQLRPPPLPMSRLMRTRAGPRVREAPHFVLTDHSQPPMQADQSIAPLIKEAVPPKPCSCMTWPPMGPRLVLTHCRYHCRSCHRLCRVDRGRAAARPRSPVPACHRAIYKLYGSQTRVSIPRNLFLGSSMAVARPAGPLQLLPTPGAPLRDTALKSPQPLTCQWGYSRRGILLAGQLNLVRNHWGGIRDRLLSGSSHRRTPRDRLAAPTLAAPTHSRPLTLSCSCATASCELRVHGTAGVGFAGGVCR